MPLPEKWRSALSHIPLQSTGRLFWATYYVALLAATFALLQRCSTRWQVVLLSCAIILQCVDLVPGFANLRTTLSTRANNGEVPGLHGDFWDAAGHRYTLLRVLPLSKRADWEQLAFYANSHRMGMDGVRAAFRAAAIRSARSRGRDGMSQLRYSQRHAQYGHGGNGIRVPRALPAQAAQLALLPAFFGLAEAVALAGGVLALSGPRTPPHGSEDTLASGIFFNVSL